MEKVLNHCQALKKHKKNRLPGRAVARTSGCPGWFGRFPQSLSVVPPVLDVSSFKHLEYFLQYFQIRSVYEPKLAQV
jgi:hypothetical protein